MVAVSLKKLFFKQKTAYEITTGLVGSEMCIRDRAGWLGPSSPVPLDVEANLPGLGPTNFRFSDLQKTGYRIKRLQAYLAACWPLTSRGPADI